MAVENHDIKLANTGNECPDSVVENGDLRAEVGIETAVLISLFTDRFIEEAELPQGQFDVRGWWADDLNTDQDKIGSRYWALERSKIIPENLSAWKTATEQALQWLIDDGLAESITVEVTIG